MCGICGFSGTKNPEILKKMGNSIIHRGPDDDGYYSDGHMNLCNRRLSIVDLNMGKQPIHNEDKTLWVVLNGEIYNHELLREDLKLKGHKFYTDHSDTEVIVHMYEEYGIDFLNMINGMYAIAIWNRKDNKLFLARDRMGVKPLFYAIVNDEIVFSSEIKSILEYPWYKKIINYNALYQYFSFKNVLAPDTAFKGIYAVLPGSYLKWEKDSIVCEKYWQIDFSCPVKDSFEEAKEKIRDMLIDAVKIRMPKDVDMGTFLSGGLDSSLVTAISSNYVGGRLKTFSLCYPTLTKSIYKKDRDEYYAKKVSEQYGTEHHKYVLTADEMIKELPNVVRSFDQPFSGVISTYYLSSDISKYVKVAVSGDGADELFGSYLLHRISTPFEKYSLARKDGLSSCEAYKLVMSMGAEFSDEYMKKKYKLTGGEISNLAYSLLQIGDQEKRFIFTNDFREKLEGNVSTKSIVDDFFSNSTASSYMNKVLEYDWNSLLPNQILAFTDFLSMAHSLEIRSPFLDYRLVEYVASLPGEYKINNGKTKWILKEVAREFLDDDVIDRPKEGFVQPTYEWLQTELKEYALDTLSLSSIQKYGVLEYEYVNDVLKSYYTDPTTNIQKSQLIWNLIMFQEWCGQYL